MSLSSVGSATSLYANQGLNSLNSISSGDGDSSQVKGAGGHHHHHGGGGGLLQSIMQSLQSVGLNVPTGNAANSAGAGNSN
ncbi:MAG: hypothetical protein ABSB19_11335, partial [Methylomonas sp.]